MLSSGRADRAALSNRARGFAYGSQRTAGIRRPGAIATCAGTFVEAVREVIVGDFASDASSFGDDPDAPVLLNVSPSSQISSTHSTNASTALLTDEADHTMYRSMVGIGSTSLTATEDAPAVPIPTAAARDSDAKAT
jgi:hypothetical protein